MLRFMETLMMISKLVSWGMKIMRMIGDNAHNYFGYVSF